MEARLLLRRTAQREKLETCCERFSPLSMKEIPTESDFTWDGGPIRGFDPDVREAWKNFGGLSLEEAHAKFREKPRYYGEDFGWMGARAFAYYFPVIEDYLRSEPECEHDTLDEADWFAYCIQSRFEDSLPDVRHLKERVLSLCRLVLDCPSRFGWDGPNQRRVLNSWSRLEEFVRTVTMPAP